MSKNKINRRKKTHPKPSSVEQGTVLPSFRDRETFSLSSAPSFALREETNAIACKFIPFNRCLMAVKHGNIYWFM